MSRQEPRLFAKLPDYVCTPDGMAIDAEGNLYIADFCANAVAQVAPNGKVSLIAQSPDTDGPQMANSKHEMPATLSELEPRGEPGGGDAPAVPRVEGRPGFRLC